MVSDTIFKLSSRELFYLKNSAFPKNHLSRSLQAHQAKETTTCFMYRQS